MGKGGVSGSNTQPDSMDALPMIGPGPWDLHGRPRTDVPYGLPNAPRPPANQPSPGGKKGGGGTQPGEDIDGLYLRGGPQNRHVPVRSIAKPTLDVMPSAPQPTTPRSRSGTASPFPWSMPY